MVKRIIGSRLFVTLTIVTAVLAVSVLIILSSRAPTARIALKAVDDGTGGVVVAWINKQGIHVQRIGSDGELLWTNEDVWGGIKSTQFIHFDIVGDGQGGVIITWGDRSNLSDDLYRYGPFPDYAQRLSANGKPLWGKGIPAGVSGEWPGPEVVPDGTGGIFIVYNDFKPVYRAPDEDYFRLQKIDHDGNPVWGERGILLCSSPQRCSSFQVVNDGSGGAIVAWGISQADTTHIYAQRYNANAQPIWQEGGIPIAVDDGTVISFISISDGSGGVITMLGTKAQRLDAEGKLLWGGEGINIRITGIGIDYKIDYMGYKMDYDGLGGVVTVHQEKSYISGTYPRIVWQSRLYARRLSGDSHPLWTTEPPLTTEEGEMLEPVIVGDGSGGAFVAWRTWERAFNLRGKVLAQKLDAGGKTLCGDKGIMVFTVPDIKYQGVPTMISDGSGGAIILALVGKNPLNGDMVYAQRLDAGGNTLWGDGIKVSP
jgi:hypothetical protein